LGGTVLDLVPSLILVAYKMIRLEDIQGGDLKIYREETSKSGVSMMEEQGISNVHNV
jgi:hypothetical protein